jgi:hypothetical protein
MGISWLSLFSSMDRDYKRDAYKFYEICERNPGLTHSDVLKKTQLWEPDHRQMVIEFCQSLNWVRVEEYRPRRGSASKRYWPIPKTVAAETPLEAATREIDEARGLILRLQASIDAAAARLAELQSQQPLAA